MGSGDETWVEVVGVSGKLQEGGVLVVLTYYLPISIPFPTGFSSTSSCLKMDVPMFRGEGALLSADCGCFESRCADLKVGERPMREL